LTWSLTDDMANVVGSFCGPMRIVGPKIGGP
jgi:hypothetical protein